RLSASSPLMTAINSIRLFVVIASPPDSSISFPEAGCRRINAQPPGPGLPLQAPSVYRSTIGSGSAAESLSAWPTGQEDSDGRRVGGFDIALFDLPAEPAAQSDVGAATPARSSTR